MREAAETLLQCLLDMGESNSNPVLEVISGESTVVEEVKYPKGHLHFNGTGWRAYYHTHANHSDIHHVFSAEHGHFHFFVRVDKASDTWSHLGALSMDALGQPLRWFMVNHWVTGESWVEANPLIALIENIPYQKQDSILEQWLLCMLYIYKAEISGLLLRRDQQPNIQDEQQRQNREIYLLAEGKIDLQQKLEQIFNL